MKLDNEYHKVHERCMSHYWFVIVFYFIEDDIMV